MRSRLAWSAFFEEHPIVVGPTWTQPPFEHGFDVSSDEAGLADARAACASSRR